jgi:hypothetical protein
MAAAKTAATAISGSRRFRLSTKGKTRAVMAIPIRFGQPESSSFPPR